MSTILIGGGTGLIGTRLSNLLRQQGHQVLHLSRKKNLAAPFPKYAWNLNKNEIDMDAVAQANYIINLAGAGIVDKRWTKDRKKVIIDSRTKSTLLLKQAVEQLDKPPKAIIAASAIGYYGDRGEERLDETSAPGQSGFLAECTIAWENAIQELKALPSRLAVIRVGIVLSSKGGALPPFLLQDKFRLGTYFGNGKQFYSWIHIDDLCGMFIHAIENEKMEGIFNGVGPSPVSMYDLTKAVSKAQHKKAIMVPAPAFAIRLGMGEMADAVLSSTHVSSKKIESFGFQFKHPDLIPALQNIIQEKV